MLFPALVTDLCQLSCLRTHSPVSSADQTLSSPPQEIYLVVAHVVHKHNLIAYTLKRNFGGDTFIRQFYNIFLDHALRSVEIWALGWALGEGS